MNASKSALNDLGFFPPVCLLSDPICTLRGALHDSLKFTAIRECSVSVSLQVGTGVSPALPLWGHRDQKSGSRPLIGRSQSDAAGRAWCECFGNLYWSNLGHVRIV